MLTTSPFLQYSPAATGNLPDWRALWPSRGARVAVLLLIVAVLNAVDLYMTLAQMTSHGMFEDNPIVVWLVEQTNSAIALAAYKIALVLFGVGLLFHLRHRFSAELGGWLAFAIFGALTVQWAQYTAFLNGLEPGLVEQMAQQPGWVVIG